MMMHSPKSTTTVLCVRSALLAAALAFAATPAHAQRALGDGRALDNNPRVGSGGINTRAPSFQRELEFRNAIATGNAPGGLSFRGDIGYRAPGEFRGQLGSDALFAFRRDSLYSGLAGMGIRGTDALQYQFSMTTGSRITSDLLGGSSYTRLGRVNTAADASARRLDTTPGGDFVSGRRDRATGSTMSGTARDGSASDGSPFAESPSMGTLRSTSAYRSVGSLTPEILSTYQEGIDRETYAVVASPLRGLASTPLDAPGRADRRRDSRAPDQAVRTSYDDMLDRLRDQAETQRAEELAEGKLEEGDEALEGDAATNVWMRRRFLRLHEKLHGMEREDRADTQDAINQQRDGAATDDDAPGSPAAPQIPDSAAPQIRFTDEPDRVDETSFTIDPRTLEILRSNDGVVTHLIDPDAEERDIYGEHIAAGERLIRDGRYFDAEERFTSALSIRPGDVTAQIGRLHAQIGAGLVMSGALNLRALMTEHPEVIAQRYQEGLLPSQRRVDKMITNLRERIGLSGDRSGTGRPEESDRVRLASALLLSYLGYQSGDPDQIRAGLRVISDIGDPSDQRFVHLVRAVWLGMDEPRGSP